MKASFKFIFAALAATVALAACTKEITPPNFENDKVAPAAEGSRVIAVSFATQTKTALADDGLQPKFSPNDSILLSNGVALDTCDVKIDDKTGVATISTDLTGPLTAVYPYKAAKMNGNKPCQIDSVIVSTEQDGTFASANICMAKEITDKAVFENKTALFCITPGAGANTKYVEVSAEAGFDIANDVPTGSTHTSLDKIHVATTTADSVWVSILVPDGLTIGKLSFSDGTNVKTITGDRASESVASNTIYKVTVPKSFTITCEPVTITGASFKVMKGSEEVTKASPGDELKVNVTCPNGYIVGGITVSKTTDSSTTVVVTDGTFQMPEYPVTIKVEFELDESGGGTEMEHGGLLG